MKKLLDFTTERDPRVSAPQKEHIRIGEQNKIKKHARRLPRTALFLAIQEISIYESNRSTEEHRKRLQIGWERVSVSSIF